MIHAIFVRTKNDFKNALGIGRKYGLRRFVMELKIGTAAPDFVVEDWQGRRVSLEEIKGQKNLFIVFNRGFV